MNYLSVKESAQKDFLYHTHRAVTLKNKENNFFILIIDYKKVEFLFDSITTQKNTYFRVIHLFKDEELENIIAKEIDWMKVLRPIGTPRVLSISDASIISELIGGNTSEYFILSISDIQRAEISPPDEYRMKGSIFPFDLTCKLDLSNLNLKKIYKDYLSFVEIKEGN